ncbi:hypothetical protein H8S45_15585, partial [Agathobaculum sp. NSJ-28]|nr:hypothetical protein [Agathobaculum faecis]
MKKGLMISMMAFGAAAMLAGCTPTIASSAGNAGYPQQGAPSQTGSLLQSGQVPVSDMPSVEQAAVAENQAATNQNSGNTGSGQQPTTQISEEQAKQIALEHAQIKESDAAFLWAKLDYDDGVL